MYFIDFEYDGQRLSDFECVICNILEDNGVSAVSLGGELTFNTFHVLTTNKFNLSSTQYDTAYTTTFEICKYDCNDFENKIFSETEIKYIKRWLEKKTFKKFKAIYKDGEMANVYYNASFKVEAIRFTGNIIGFQLTMQTDAPFAYYDEVEYTMTFTEDNLQQSYYDISDEIGYIYPSSMIIEILSDGDFELVNSQEPERVTSIKNCKSGEIITLVSNLYPTTSLVSHTRLYNDFNYVFPRICNENEDIYKNGVAVDNMENIFTVNMPCTITFKYSPICKMGII